MDLLCCAASTALLTEALVGPPTVVFALPSTPASSDFCQLNVLVRTNPCVGRRVILVWSESYQVLPSGSPDTGIKPNCGNGRSDCATVLFAEKPGYGTPRLYCA